MKVLKSIRLDINKQIYDNIVAKQGDSARYLLFRLLDNGVPFSLEGKTVRIYGSKPDGKKVFNNATVVDIKKGLVELQLTTQMLSVGGTLKLELTIYDGEEVFSTIPFEIEIIRSIRDDAAIESTNEFSALIRGLLKLDEWDNLFKETSCKIEEKYTERLNKLDSQLLENTKKLNSEINVKYPPAPIKGAKGDGITDDSVVIKAIIEYVQQFYSGSKYSGNINTLVFPEGIYKIEQQIEIPSFIHIKALGMVELHSYVENDSAIWFNTKLDPSVSGYDKDWFRGKTTGYLTDGATGGFFLKNKCGDVNYKGEIFTGDTKGAIGIEIGDREKVSDTSLIAHYVNNNFRIELFHVGLKLNSVVNYIGSFDNVKIAFCDICLEYGSLKGIDSGENFNFNQCTFANSKCILKFNDNNPIGIFINFNNCSLDYCYNLIFNKNRYGANVRFRGCHIEGIYTKSYVDKLKTSSITPLEEGCFGLVRNVADDSGCILNVTFTDTLISMFKGTGYAITCKRFGDNTINFENVQLYCNNDFKDNYIADDWKFLCDENTIVIKKDIQYILDKKGFFLQKRLSLIKETNFENTAIKKYNDGSKVGDFNIYWTQGIWDYDILNFVSNKKVLQANLKDDTNRFYLEKSKTIKVKTGDIFIIDFAFRFKGTITFNISLRDSTHKDTLITNSLDYNFNNNDDWNKWNSLGDKAYMVVKESAFDGEATLQITMPKNIGNTSRMIQLTDIYLYKIN